MEAALVLGWMSNTVYDGLNVIVLYVCPSEFLSQRSVIDMLKKELNFSQLREVHHFIVLIPCLYILLTCWFFFLLHSVSFPVLTL